MRTESSPRTGRHSETALRRGPVGTSSAALVSALLLALARDVSTAPNAAGAETPAPSPIAWQPFSDAVFEKAKKENRLVLLDLEAVWCHWCHVMDEITYRDPAVVALLARRYVAVKVDQESRPDLANRYEEYGWPATILLDANGRELAKRSGYIPPKPMASMLQAFADDPTPGPSAPPEAAARPASAAALSPELRANLREAFAASYDAKEGSWGFSHKYLEWQSVEYAMERARRGDAEAERMAKRTLSAARALLDPVWGGVYQYSTGGVWTEPHFEKLVLFQAENLRIYSLAYLAWRDPEHLAAARSIHAYLGRFLKSPEGAFYVSQDADLVPGVHSADYFEKGDTARRALGVPKVDTHRYARENGWVVRALAAYFAATGETAVLEEAVRAAEWVLANRALEGGGFRHDGVDAAGPYLGDTLAMGQAFLALHGATGERVWLERAARAADFLGARFRDRAAGFATAAASGVLPSRPQRDENAAVVRFASLLAAYTGKAAHRALAEHAIRFVASPDVARSRPVGGVLLADLEVSRPPLHVTVVGSKKSPAARALFLEAQRLPTTFKRVDWWDRSEGPLPNPDVAYPDLGEPAAFSCAEGLCSPPAFKPEELARRLARLGS